MATDSASPHDKPGSKKKVQYQKVANMFGVSWIVARQWFHDGCPEEQGYLNVALWVVANITRELKPNDEGWKLLNDACGSEEAANAFVGYAQESGASEAVDFSTDESIASDDSTEPKGVQHAALEALIEEVLSDTSIEGCLNRTLMIERKIFRDSMFRADPKNLAAYKAICGLRIELEEKVQDAVAKRDSLVSIDSVINAAATVVSIVLNEIRALPESAAARVNPSNPALAKEELESVIKQLVDSANRQATAQLREIETARTTSTTSTT